MRALLSQLRKEEHLIDTFDADGWRGARCGCGQAGLGFWGFEVREFWYGADRCMWHGAGCGCGAAACALLPMFSCCFAACTHLPCLAAFSCVCAHSLLNLRLDDELFVLCGWERCTKQAARLLSVHEVCAQCAERACLLAGLHSFTPYQRRFLAFCTSMHHLMCHTTRTTPASHLHHSREKVRLNSELERAAKVGRFMHPHATTWIDNQSDRARGQLYPDSSYCAGCTSWHPLWALICAPTGCPKSPDHSQQHAPEQPASSCFTAVSC